MNKINIGLLSGLFEVGFENRLAKTDAGSECCRVISGLSRQKLISVATDVDFSLYNYIGEFFERCEERGVEMTDETFATMAFFYALVKNELLEVHFNDYQIEDFEKKLFASTSNNPYVQLSKYFITEDETYLDAFCNNTISLFDFYFILKIAVCVINDKEYVLAKKLTINFEYLVDTIEVFRDNIVLFENVLSMVSNYNLYNKDTKIWNLYIKGMTSKMDTMANVKRLKSMGYTDSNIAALNYYLKKEYAGNLKWQRALVSLLQLLAKKEDAFNELDINVLKDIFGRVRDFGVKMESGNVTSLSDAIRYYNVFENIENVDNFRTIHSLAYASDLPNYNSMYVSFDNERYAEYLDAAKDVLKNNSSLSFDVWFTTNINKVGTTNVNALVQKIEAYTGHSILEMFFTDNNYFSFAYGTRDNLFGFFVKNNIVNIIDNVDAIDFKLIERFFHFENGKGKYACIKHFYDINDFGKALDIINRDVCSRSSTSLAKVIPDDMTAEETMNFFNMLCEMAATISKNAFRFAFLNMMLNCKAQVEFAFGKETAHTLYVNGLALSETLEEKSFYDYSKNSVISRLNELWMSDEEKAEKKRLADEKAEKERQEKIEQANAAVKEKIDMLVNRYREKTNIVYSSYGLYRFVKDNLDYYGSKLSVFRDWAKTILSEGTVLKSNVSSFMETLGDMYEYGTLTFDEMKSIVSSMTIVSDEATEMVA